MRRLARWTLDALTALSLLLCVATAGLWLLSHWRLVHMRVPYPPARYEVRIRNGEFGVNNGPQIEEDRAALGRALDASRQAQADIDRAMRTDDTTLWLESRARLFAAIGDEETRIHPVLRQIWRDKRVVPAAALTFALLATPGVVHRIRERRRERMVRAGLCPGCGYDMRATPAKCPECGRAATAGEVVA